MKKIIERCSILLVYLGLFPLHAQKYVYRGIVLHQTQIIPFELRLSIEGSSVTGYSITDMAGRDETQSKITGYYKREKDSLYFTEEDILYTKSKAEKIDFCFVNFKGIWDKSEKNKRILGSFVGRYQNKSTCAEGEISMMEAPSFEEKTSQPTKETEPNTNIQEPTKENIEKKTRISLQLKNRETLTLVNKSKEIQLIIFDNGKEDGDALSIEVNDSLTLYNFRLSLEKKILTIPIRKNKTTIKILSLSEGKIPYNTARFQIVQAKDTVSLNLNMKAHQNAFIKVLRK